MTLYQQARFLTGARSAGAFPTDEGAEVAFAGRSNAGKSSALNALTGQKSLARTSKTPGRTREINFFTLDEQRRLVDLPGYGYAKVSGQVQAQWHQAMDRYLSGRASLRGLVVLMDIRHPLMPADQELVEWCGAAQIPLHVLLTKSDKLSRNQGLSARFAVERALGQARNGATVQLFSALKKIGIEELASKLDDWFTPET